MLLGAITKSTGGVISNEDGSLQNHRKFIEMFPDK
jgi:hypothetical protein